MAKYEPIGFENEVPSATPLKYKITDDTEGVIAESATIELETPVTPGTPLNATNLNHIEQGIVDLEASTPPGVFQAKGDLFAGAGSKTGVRLPIGANGRVLQADNTQASGMRWAYEYLRDMIQAKGDLLVGTGADTATRLPVGANGRVLTADSGQASGMRWALEYMRDLIAAKGDLLVGTAADTATRLAAGANGQVLTADSGQSAGVKWAPYIVYGRWTAANYQNGNVAPGTGFIYVGDFGLSASVKAVYVSVEATPDNADGLIRIKKQGQPGIGAVILRAQTVGKPVAAAGWVEVGAGGALDFVVSGASWTAVYAEIFAYHL